MAVPFDHIASSLFTKSAIGQLQRKVVWNYLEKIIPGLKGFEMLELEYEKDDDAVLFGENGFNMLAVDIGSETQKLTEKKAEQFSMQHSISSHYLDLESFDETIFDKKFDLVFSNFGGLNCINPQSFKNLMEKLPSILNPDGRFIGVIMPKFCAWETIYFLLKLQFRKAFRRLTSNEVPDVYGENVRTWFYNPSQVLKWSVKKFSLIALRPVGFALPPSCLGSFFKFRSGLLLGLTLLDKKTQASYLSGMSDHFIIDLKLR